MSLLLFDSLVRFFFFCGEDGRRSFWGCRTGGFDLVRFGPSTPCSLVFVFVGWAQFFCRIGWFFFPASTYYDKTWFFPSLVFGATRLEGVFFFNLEGWFRLFDLPFPYIGFSAKYARYKLAPLLILFCFF